MRFFKIIGFFLLFIFGVVMVLGLIAPKDYTVVRSVDINAAPNQVWEYVNSLEDLHEWSPWKDRDTNQVVTYAGNSGEVGSVMTWKGNEEVGEGSQEITGVIAEKELKTLLTFIMPFGESQSNASVLLETNENGTKVSWEFNGSTPYPMNAMLLFTDMDAMLGKDFEQGLSNLKTLVESASASAFNTEVEYVLEGDQAFVLKRDMVSFTDIEDYFSEHLPALYTALSAQGLNTEIAGPATGIYYTWDTNLNESYMAVGVPVKNAELKLEGYETLIVPAGNTLQLTYQGDYEEFGGEAHDKLSAYTQEAGYEYTGPVRETYLIGATDGAAAEDWLTKVIYYVK